MEKTALKWSGKTLPPLTFFALYYLYVWQWVDPSLLYHGDGALQFPTFPLGFSFFESALVSPGGLTKYLSALLSQSYYYPWAGALVITVCAAVLGLMADLLVKATCGVRVPAIWSVPGLFVLALSSLYIHELALLLGLAAALAAARAYAGALGLDRKLRVGIFAAGGVLLYHLGGSCLLYAAICGSLELRGRRGYLLLVGYLAGSVAIPFVFGGYVFEQSVPGVWVGLLPSNSDVGLSGRTALLGLFLFLSVAGVVSALWRAMAPARPRGPAATPSSPLQANGGSEADGQTEEERRAHPAGPPARRTLPERLRAWLARPAFELEAVLVAGAIVAFLSFNGDRIKLRQINKFAGQERWENVLQVARRLDRESCTFRSAHSVTRALYETGRLPDEMFAYHQHRGGYMVCWGLGSKRFDQVLERKAPWGVERLQTVDLSSWDWYTLRLQYFAALGDVNLRLGLANEAEHEACEALEAFGEHPVILKRLAQVSIAKGRTEAARVYLNALSRYVHHRAYAQEALKRLLDDPRWSSAETEHIRSVMLEGVPGMLSRYVEDRFGELLRRNRRNRMAFEYLMAYYLLNLRLDDFVRELDRLGDFDYDRIPRHYGEAILIHESLAHEKVELGGREISLRTRMAYRQFCDKLVELARRGDRRGAQRVLGAAFGDTYFYYYFLGSS